MRILFCSQFYSPSVGGVQEVIRHLAERLVFRGHTVTVATTGLRARDFDTLNGVFIKGFDISGNWVSGMLGEVEEYRQFVCAGAFDILMIYAAQQWTFDALWPVLKSLRCSKIFIPCGLAGLYERGYTKYYQELPQILRTFDHLIFHATKYRDIDFVRHLGFKDWTVISNGADEEEFCVEADPTFRSRYGIPEQSFVFLTVGSFTGLKGHAEIVRAFAQLAVPESQHVTLILNGNEVVRIEKGPMDVCHKIMGLIRIQGVLGTVKQVAIKLLGSSTTPRAIAESINRSQFNKRVLVHDLPRKELTQAFIAADLFVFASNIEYSPLVLYEAAAAGTPFLSVDVGNAVEIANWTGAGVICPSNHDSKGYTRVDEKVLAQSMGELMQQSKLLEKLGATGRETWGMKFTWEKVTDRYEQLFSQLVAQHR